MSDDTFMLAGLHKLAQQNGDGLIPELLEGLKRVEKESISNAEIVRLPGLHERGGHPKYNKSSAEQATIINFPAPKWQRNGSRRGG